MSYKQACLLVPSSSVTTRRNKTSRGCRSRSITLIHTDLDLESVFHTLLLRHPLGRRLFLSTSLRLIFRFRIAPGFFCPVAFAAPLSSLHHHSGARAGRSPSSIESHPTDCRREPLAVFRESQHPKEIERNAASWYRKLSFASELDDRPPMIITAETPLPISTSRIRRRKGYTTDRGGRMIS